MQQARHLSTNELSAALGAVRAAPQVAAAAPQHSVRGGIEFNGGAVTKEDSQSLGNTFEAEAQQKLDAKRRVFPFRYTITANRSDLEHGVAKKVAFEVEGASSAHLAIDKISASIKSTHTAPIGVLFDKLPGAVPMQYDKDSRQQKSGPYHATAPSVYEAAPGKTTVYERKHKLDAYGLVHYGNTSEQKLRAEIDHDKLTKQDRISYNSVLCGMLTRKNPEVLQLAKKITVKRDAETPGGEPVEEHYLAFEGTKVLDSAVSAIMKTITNPDHVASKIPGDNLQVTLVPLSAQGYDHLQSVGAELGADGKIAVTLDGEIEAYVLN